MSISCELFQSKQEHTNDFTFEVINEMEGGGDDVCDLNLQRKNIQGDSMGIQELA